ncbi:hypothetical protein MKX79_03920 [Viridibacillus sp. FSL R5-0468]|uniref:hypothetical protein n=1 Tax=Viridibacillus sp. FSL R5-0468 TaxID=2921640 RepID=UPI0030F56D16
MDNTFNSPFDDIIKQQAKLREMLKSPISNILNQQAAFREALQSPINDILNQQIAFRETLQSPISDIVNQQAAIREALQSPINEILNQQAAFRESTQSTLSELIRQHSAISPSDALASYNYLRAVNFNELIEEYENNNQPIDASNDLPSTLTVRTSNELTEEQLNQVSQLIEGTLQQLQNNQPGKFQKMIMDAFNSIGVDLVKNVFIFVLKHLWLLLILNSQVNHQVVIDSMQKQIPIGVKVDSSVVKKVIKDEGISEYENIHHIGIVRVETFIREGKSKNAPVTYSKKIKVNTVVNIIGKKGNWVKIEVALNEEYIDGWVEESKIVKLKKKKSEIK